MKNQYVGDIGDFGKYSLLRAFAEEGIRVGVNWYLTGDDGSNDGRFVDYLQKSGLRRYSPIVYDTLREIAGRKNKSVKDIQESSLIPGACFYADRLESEGTPAERENARKLWFEESMSALSSAELIFMDPDNGLLERNDAARANADKYILPDEAERYFYAGKNVLYYCHKGRRGYELWRDYKSIMFERITEARPAVLTYHKGTQRSYIFLIHEEDFVRYRKILERFLKVWYGIFSEEFTSKGDPAGKIDGEAFVLEKPDGTVIAIEKRADGRIQTRSSERPGVTVIMELDYFCRQIGY